MPQQLCEAKRRDRLLKFTNLCQMLKASYENLADLQDDVKQDELSIDFRSKIGLVTAENEPSEVPQY